MSTTSEHVSATAAQAALDVRATFGRLRRRMRELSSSDDLTPSQASVLVTLGKGEVSTASALAAAEGVRPQSMAATLAALEQQGLIRRTPDAADGRRTIVSLTDAGSERDQGNRAAREEWIGRAMEDRYTEDERQRIIAAMALLERLVQA